jgi:hypothetical protein
MKDTIVLSVALTSPDLQAAYELSTADSDKACNLLSVGQVDETALVEFIRRLYQTAKDTGLLNEQYSPCLIAGRMEVV